MKGLIRSFPHYRQYDKMDCGPTCLRMIAKFHGRRYTMDSLRQKSGINREGVSLLGISDAADKIGFHTVGAKLTWQQFNTEEIIQAYYGWLKNAVITKTPTTFLSGYELPAACRVKYLAALIPGLVDAFGNQKGMNTMKGNSVSAKISEK